MKNEPGSDSLLFDIIVESDIKYKWLVKYKIKKLRKKTGDKLYWTEMWSGFK
jgi:hypothetical protein